MKRTKSCRRGQGVAEYGLILVLIALICFLGLTSMGDSNERFFTDLSDRVTEVTDEEVGGLPVGIEGANTDIFQ